MEPGRVWLDVTTTRHAGGSSDGTTRVERSLARELPQFLPGRLGFCAYNRTLRRFAPVPQPAAADPLARRSGGSGRNGRMRSAGKAVERALRRLVKSGIGRVASLAGGAARGPFAEAAAGDVLVLAGENWSRYDFEVLRALRRDGVRVAALLQDMIPVVHPQFFDSTAFLARFRAYVDFLARDADMVFAISDSTRDDFLEAAPTADPAKVVRVELGADIAPAEQEQRRPAGLDALGARPFVLSVSTIQVRKNFDLLYRLWQKFAIEGRHDQPHLVIVGRPGFGSADLLHLMRSDPWIGDTVTILDRASDAELAWLYAHCAFTLYPSWYEGWGLPLSESLAYGKTFIASDRSSLPEAGQGLGIHLDPYDLVSWEREVLRLANDAEARTVMERRVVAERHLSHWADCARQIATALDRLAGLPA
jgi:glycosyltransferase involved in cell wall biosynthesis